MKYLFYFIFYIVRSVLQVLFLLLIFIWSPAYVIRKTKDWNKMHYRYSSILTILIDQQYYDDMIWEHFDGEDY